MLCTFKNFRTILSQLKIIVNLEKSNEMLIRKIKQKKKRKEKISTAQKMKFSAKGFCSKCH